MTTCLGVRKPFSQWLVFLKGKISSLQLTCAKFLEELWHCQRGIWIIAALQYLKKLPPFSSDEHMYELSSMMNKTDPGCLKKGFWLGATDLQQESVWKPMPGLPPITEELWSYRQPNGGVFENCIVVKDLPGLSPEERKIHTGWIDVICSSHRCPLCQIYNIQHFTLRGLCKRSR